MKTDISKAAAGKPPILVRVDNLESKMDSILDSLTRIAQDHNGFTKLFDAVLSILGPDVVLEKVKALKAAEDEQKIQAMEERNRAQCDEIQSNIESGGLREADVVGAFGLVELTETAPDGTVRRPEKVWVSLASLEPKIKDALVGLGAGQWAQLEDGTKLEISRIVELNSAQEIAAVDAEVANKAE